MCKDFLRKKKKLRLRSRNGVDVLARGNVDRSQGKHHAFRLQILREERCEATPSKKKSIRSMQ